MLGIQFENYTVDRLPLFDGHYSLRFFCVGLRDAEEGTVRILGFFKSDHGVSSRRNSGKNKTSLLVRHNVGAVVSRRRPVCVTMSRDRCVGDRPVLRVDDNPLDGSCGLWEIRFGLPE